MAAHPWNQQNLTQVKTMSDWLNLSSILNSFLGSLFVALIFLSTYPMWVKWLKKWLAAKSQQDTLIKKFFKDATPLIVSVSILLGLIYLEVIFWKNLEHQRTPTHHSTLTADEAKMAAYECEMKSVEATSEIRGANERNIARINYRSACLQSKGFQWESGHDSK